MKKNMISLFTFFAALCFLGTADLQAAGNKDTIEKGIYIGEVDVSYMTASEASAAVNDYISQIGKSVITLNAMNDNKSTISAKDMGVKWQNANIIEEAIALGKEGNIVQRYKALKDLEHENKVFELIISADKSAIKSFIEEDCTQYNVKAVDAVLTRENGAFNIEPGQTGVSINVEESADSIYDYLITEWDGKDGTIDLIAETEQPRGTEEELSKVKDVLGTFTTDYSTSGYNRSGNVANGCSLINGTLLYPGDSFSMYEAVTPFTEANGYFMAGSYLNGLVVDSLGGGICQVSTTLYNAVLKAELDVTERYNHSMIVTYVELSEDAAIAGTSKDFKFTNNLDHPVYIEGQTANKKITFTVYGVETRPSDRKVTYESKIISTTPAQGEKVVADPSQGIGYVKVQSAHTGYVAELWKVVTEGGVEVSRTQVNKSTYKMVPRTASVGVASSDPSAVAAVNAAIATQSIDHVRATIAGIGTKTPEQIAQEQAIKAQQDAIAQQQAAIQQAQEADGVAP